MTADRAFPTPDANDAAVDLVDVVKRYGDRIAVDGLNLAVRRAEVLALLGPNGAGKTTTVEMCEGFLSPDSGTVRVLGLDPAADRDELSRRIGVMLQGGGAYPGARVGEMIRLIASFHADPHDPEWLLDMLALTEHRSTPYRRLSGGQAQRLSLACALVGRPELVFLDEPTAGLDAQSRRLVWDLVDALRADGVTVVLTTHFMEEAERLADRVVVIDHGRTVASGTPSELTRADGDSRISLTTLDPLDVDALCAAVPAIITIGPADAGRRRLDCDPSPAVIAAITAECARQGVLVTDLRVASRTLEDAFLDLTGTEMRG